MEIEAFIASSVRAASIWVGRADRHFDATLYERRSPPHTSADHQYASNVNHTSIATLPGLHGPSSNLYYVMSINDGCFDLDMLHRLRQYLKELADAEREASRLVREHRSKASKVIASDIENARKRGDTLTVRRLKRVQNVIAAIEESPAALLHH